MGKSRKFKTSSENISTEQPRKVMLKEMKEIRYDPICILY